MHACFGIKNARYLNTFESKKRKYISYTESILYVFAHTIADKDVEILRQLLIAQ